MVFVRRLLVAPLTQPFAVGKLVADRSLDEGLERGPITREPFAPDRYILVFEKLDCIPLRERSSLPTTVREATDPIDEVFGQPLRLEVPGHRRIDAALRVLPERI